MNGRVLVLCAGEHTRWKSPAPKQLVRVVNEEALIARTVRQCRTRFGGEDPLLISHLQCLRAYSHNAVLPQKRRFIIETLYSSLPFWGETWTVVLLGDVLYSDSLVNLIIDERDEHDYRFYGTQGEIYALTYTDKATIYNYLATLVDYAEIQACRGKLWDLYYALSKYPINESEKGLIDRAADEHFYRVSDGTCDFDTLEQYSQWRKMYDRREINL